jgi:nitrogen-specific signal transduction histidine kinase
LTKKIKAETKKSNIADKKYSEAVEICRQLQDKYYDDEMPKVLEEFQTMEQWRLNLTKQFLENFANLQRGVGPEIVSAAERIAKSVQDINVDEVRYVFAFWIFGIFLN